jgi:hypothetical protein
VGADSWPAATRAHRPRAGGATAGCTGGVAAQNRGGGVLMCGPHGTVPGGAGQTHLNPIWNLNGFKFFQIPSKFDWSKNDLPRLKKFEIKYSFEDLKKMNNFIHRNFFRFERDFEKKLENF